MEPTKKTTNTSSSIPMAGATTKMPKSVMPKKGTIAYAAMKNAIGNAKAEENRRTKIKAEIKTAGLLAAINKVINANKKTIKK